MARKRETVDQDFAARLLPGEKPTLRTLARLSGFAVATVSRALSDAPDIGDNTKNLVKHIAEAVGYVPNRAGVRLRTGKTNVISLLLPMTDEETKELAEEAIFESEYIDYKKKGHEITLEGKEVIDGVDCYKLKVHKNVGNDMEESVEYHFFDTENFVPIMIRTTIKVGPGKGGTAEEYLSDYQETEYGIIMPYYFETKMEGQVVNQIVVEKVDINVDIEDSIFEMPAAE